jgi:hypothetical protein
LSKNKRSIKIIPLTVLILIGIAILISDFLYYPLSLPKIITSENSQWIQISGYIFYLIFITAIAIEILAIKKTIKFLTNNFKNNDKDKESKSHILSSLSLPLPSSIPKIESPSSHPESEIPSNKALEKQHQPYSLWKILFNMITDKTSIRFFIPIALSYGFFYAIISSTLIIRMAGGIAHMAGIENFPSIIMMQYGPVGYIPSMSIFLSDNIGILIVPLNLIIIIIVSSLVGLNGVSSIYAFRSYISERKREENIGIRSVAARNGTKFLSILGATTSLFAACPTCASFYLFSILAGSVATTIASITTTYYILFLSLSIPLLIVSPIVNAFNIKRMIKNSNNQCKMNNKKK